VSAIVGSARAALLPQVAALALTLGLVSVLPEGGPTDGAGMAATGLLLLVGLLSSHLLGFFSLPHLTGYILAGLAVGPHGLRLISHQTVVDLEIVNTLALSLIALSGGLELRWSEVRAAARSVGTSLGFQTVVVMASQAALFFAFARFLPFCAALTTSTLIGVCLLWGALAVSRSPSATLAVLSEVRERGPLARFSIAFVMTSDVVVVVLMAVTLALARPLIEPGAEVSLDSVYAVSRGIVGSVTLGTTLGLLLIGYVRFLGDHIIALLIGFGFVLSDALHYLEFEPMLTFLTAGFVVQNLSHRGDELLHTIERTGSVVFVVFFATAGAHIDLPLLSTLWPIAVGLCVGRIAATYLAHALASRVARDAPSVRRFGWACQVSQAGLTLGLAALMSRTFPQVGEGLSSLVVATVALNELVGPIAFKWALARSGEG
jgi:Kef-type K+ transport system membrane component KefB